MRTLIEFFNAGGWPAVYSCQGSPDRTVGQPGCPYVMFASAESLAGATAALAELSLSAGHSELATRALGAVTAPLGPPERRWVQTHGAAWVYDDVSWNFHPIWTPTSPRELTATVRMGSDDLKAISHLLELLPAGDPDVDVAQRGQVIRGVTPGW